MEKKEFSMGIGGNKLNTLSAFKVVSLCLALSTAFYTIRPNTQILVPLVSCFCIAVGFSSIMIKYKEEKKSPTRSSGTQAEGDKLLFFYGTLKKGFHWNQKYLSSGQFVSKAITRDLFPLVIGESGVPYLLGDLPGDGRRIHGEVWRVGSKLLQGLDEYEGVTKGYYDRRTIQVSLLTPGSSCPSSSSAPHDFVLADAYFKTCSPDSLKSEKFLDEYSLEFHQKHYRAIRHIQVKQEMYLKQKDAHERT